MYLVMLDFGYFFIAVLFVIACFILEYFRILVILVLGNRHLIIEVDTIWADSWALFDLVS